MLEPNSAPDNPSSNLPTAGDTIQFQLIPFSDTKDRPALGEVIERKLKDGTSIRIGRQVIRDGQPTVAKGKHSTENDIWFSSKVVSRVHAEMWVKDGQIYIKDIGSSSGTFLNKMRLSPSGKESRPYPLKEGDILQFGIDYKGKPDDVYKSVMVRIGFYDQSWVNQQRRNANPARFRTALKMLLAAANPYASASNEQADDDSESAATDCCICIGAIGPFQALFVAPCSHCYHYKCVSSLLAQSAMFQCPMCRQVANLAASVSMESLFGEDDQDAANTSGEAIVRKMGQLRDDGDVPPGVEGGATIVSPAVQRVNTLAQNTASGDVTPRSGTPGPTAIESDAASGRNTPTPAGSANRSRPTNTTPADSATSPSVSSPIAKPIKRRASITSKINALLRRGGGKDQNEEQQLPPLAVREELGALQQALGKQDDEPTSPVSDRGGNGEGGLKRNITAHSMADQAGRGSQEIEGEASGQGPESRASVVRELAQ